MAFQALVRLHCDACKKVWEAANTAEAAKKGLFVVVVLERYTGKSEPLARFDLCGACQASKFPEPHLLELVKVDK